MPHDDPLEEADALIASGRAAEAALRLQQLLAAGRAGLLARQKVSQALLAAGNAAEALETARETALLNPTVAIAALGLGEVLAHAGLLPAAIGEYQRALRLDPDLDEARFQLGLAWLSAGEAEKALEALAPLHADHPGLDEAKAAAEQMRVQPRSDPGYVRHLFDQFSRDYDARMLGQLSYSAPAILRELAELVMQPLQPHKLRILDLGCGTGLAGEAFADLARHIDGVDLSPAMIAKAQARGRYRNLHVADLETALAEDGENYDLILAADTLVYLGDLAKVFAGAKRRLVPGGYFLFTVEKSEGADFELGPKRRWRHGQAYLRACAGHSGLEVAGLLACSPRSEAGIPVAGLALALFRQASERLV